LPSKKVHPKRLLFGQILGKGEWPGIPPRQMRHTEMRMANGSNQQLMKAVPTAGGVVRQGFDSMEMSVSADVQSQALAAQQEAEVKARWAIALRNPRDWDVVRTKLMAECRRSAFASVARYTKPVGNGKKVSGPSIRFVEAALRCMGNVYCPTTVISETLTERRVQVQVTDLEQNISWPRQITISKTVERKDPTGRTVLSERVNSQQQVTYTVIATEDEIATKEAAIISKAIRTAGLRLLPGDLIDEGQALCIETQKREIKDDPGAAKKKIVDAFAAIGIDPAALKAWLGHPLEQTSTDELQELRDIYAAIREGETKWSDVMEEKRGAVAPAAPPPPGAQAPAAAVPEPAVDEPDPAELAIKKQAEDVRAKLKAAVEAKDLKAIEALAQPITTMPEPERGLLRAEWNEAKGKAKK
jgi:hypothetical protein